MNIPTHTFTNLNGNQSGENSEAEGTHIWRHRHRTGKIFLQLPRCSCTFRETILNNRDAA